MENIAERQKEPMRILTRGKIQTEKYMLLAPWLNVEGDCWKDTWNTI
jgi:hypothetical protein